MQQLQDDANIINEWIQVKSKIISKAFLKIFLYTLVIMLDILLESIAFMFLGAFFILIGF